MPVTVAADCFDPFGIMESGQCFRIVPLGTGAVETVAFGRRLVIAQRADGHFNFDCTQADFDALWKPYFDLDTDYRALLAAAPPEDAFLARALLAGEGMRILRQDPWETLCCFILSQRKHIKAIRACVEALCNAYGEPVPGTARKSFPSPARLAALAECDARACGLGYRTPYLLDAAKKAASGEIDFVKLNQLPDGELFDALLTIHGVGIKVAECAMLFGFHRLSRAPVDVWIRRVIDEEYGGISPFEGYGRYAGVYQQYMFVLRRNEGRAFPTRAECSKNTGTQPCKARGEVRLNSRKT